MYTRRAWEGGVARPPCSAGCGSLGAGAGEVGADEVALRTLMRVSCVLMHVTVCSVLMLCVYFVCVMMYQFVLN